MESHHTTRLHLHDPMRRYHGIVLAVVSLLLAASTLVFLPGISGPFVFDDHANILHNDFIKLRTLDWQSVYHAAYSLKSGPLQRPIAMLSFALNHYFAGGFADSTSFKLTNLAIHAINGLLLFWLMRLLLARAAQLQLIAAEHGSWLAALVTLLWLIHPIQLTSVLYVVQRMAELSALFTLLGLVLYMLGRLRLVAGRPGGTGLIAAGLIGCGLLGMLSKENAVLLPIFMLVIELTLFANEWPWRLWPGLPRRTRVILTACGIAFAAIVTAWVIDYALPGYRYRSFNMIERVLTEGRVLWYYLGLIFIPRISAFGLYHDDIALSTTLLNPWTTLPSLLGIFALLTLALVIRRTQPLISLGILWFFVAHSLESTVINLEIAHEHRNYLALVGPLLVVAQLVALALRRLHVRTLGIAIAAAALTFGSITLLRADQWSDQNKLYRYEARHHPDSARSQGSLGWLLAKQGYNEEAMETLRRAAELDPREPGYLITLQLVAVRAGAALRAGDQADTLQRLETFGITALASILLQNTANCLYTTCAALSPSMEQWMTTLLRAHPSGDRSFAYNLLGRALAAQGRMHDAIDAF
ncbi:MAG: tetratricopeptide repeat protein, partial [Acidiferrobacterales bacterium]|nr:tetratricopeptide repeat protein [Acidiferrobacterales bacterium]